MILEVDHRVPKSGGGGDDIDNLVAACWDCNRGKGPLPFEGRGAEGWGGQYSSWEDSQLDGHEDWVALWVDPRFMNPRGPKLHITATFSAQLLDIANSIPSAGTIEIMTVKAVFDKADFF